MMEIVLKVEVNYKKETMEMGVVKARVNLPGSFLAAVKVGEDELDLFIRRSLAVELYREDKLSPGKAAEVAGVRNKWEMLMLLNEKGVAIDYTAEDAERDLKTLKEVPGHFSL